MLVRPCRPIAGDTSVKRPVALACHHVDTAGLRGVSPACSCESRNQESRATMPATLGSCFRRSTGSFLQIDQNPRRILDRVLERDEEGHRLAAVDQAVVVAERERSEEHTSELQSLMRISYAVFCLNKNRHRER